MNWSTMRCVALDFRGRRCGRRCQSAVPITFTWDPVIGRGIGGPHVTICRTHELGDADPNEPDARVAVVSGWLGRAWNPDAKCWTVLTTVYETRDGLTASKHWWGLRRETIFGKCDETTYDEALAEPF